MDGCSLNMAVSALACAIAKNKTNDEISILALIFTQLGDSLATIAGQNQLCNSNQNNGNSIQNLNAS